MKFRWRSVPVSYTERDSVDDSNLVAFDAHYELAAVCDHEVEVSPSTLRRMGGQWLIRSVGYLAAIASLFGILLLGLPALLERTGAVRFQSTVPVFVIAGITVFAALVGAAHHLSTSFFHTQSLKDLPAPKSVHVDPSESNQPYRDTPHAEQRDWVHVASSQWASFAFDAEATERAYAKRRPPKTVVWTAHDEVALVISSGISAAFLASAGWLARIGWVGGLAVIPLVFAVYRVLRLIRRPSTSPNAQG